MVNLGKRMRRLKPQLLNVRSGQGAAILPKPSPSSPQPRLAGIFLHYPVGPYKLVSSQSARLFRNNHLRRLKYHNPALPVSVEHENIPHRPSSWLSLMFEGTDPDALRAICKIKRPKDRIQAKIRQRRAGKMGLVKNGPATEEEKEKFATMQSPNFRDAPRDGMGPVAGDVLDAVDEVDEDADTLEQGVEEENMEALADLSGRQTVDNDEVVVDDQAPHDDELAFDEELALDDNTPLDDVSDFDVSQSEVALKVPQPEAPPERVGGAHPPLVYYTTLTLGLRGRSVSQIWSWFAKTTDCTRLPPSREDLKERRELTAVLVRSEEDRQRVKRGVDERKANDAMLKRARGEVEKLRAEA